MSGNTELSHQQKKKGTHKNKHKNNDYLTEELKDEVGNCSPNEGDRDMETGRISEAGLCEQYYQEQGVIVMM
jgi:hypothetical protein